MEFTSLAPLFTEFSQESAIVVIMAAMAGILDIGIKYWWRKRRKISPIKSSSNAVELIQTAFDELKITTSGLREQHVLLREEYNELKDEVDVYRDKYYSQIEINTQLSAQLTKLNFEIILMKENLKTEE